MKDAHLLDPTREAHAPLTAGKPFNDGVITGARFLNQAEIDLMNEIKAYGQQLGRLVQKLRDTEGLDQRWISIGTTDLQTGLMALTRGVARPTTF